jgi:hypothetical protein
MDDMIDRLENLITATSVPDLDDRLALRLALDQISGGVCRCEPCRLHAARAARYAAEARSLCAPWGAGGDALAEHARRALASYRERQARPRVYRYALYRTQFHGGGLVSRHGSLEAAEKAQRSHRGGTDCICGCYVVVDHERDPAPAPAGAEPQNPYRAAE